MNGTEPDAKAIFGEARDRPTGSDRAAYLEGACRGDAALRSRVEALLLAYLDAGNFLESPAVKPTIGAASRRTEGVGTVGVAANGATGGADGTDADETGLS